MTLIGERSATRESHRSAGARESPWQSPRGERYEVIEGKTPEIGAPFVGPDGCWAKSVGKISGFKKHITYRNKPSEGMGDESTSEEPVTTESER
ncbi:MAG: hypothetical protein ABSH28_25300 [Acidobacteriota bacterium]|jgi:hypothetical protein